MSAILPGGPDELLLLNTPTSVTRINFSAAYASLYLSVRFSVRYLKNRCSYEITKYDIEMFHHESWNLFILGSKSQRSRSQAQEQCRCGFGTLVSAGFVSLLLLLLPGKRRGRSGSSLCSSLLLCNGPIVKCSTSSRQPTTLFYDWAASLACLTNSLQSCF